MKGSFSKIFVLTGAGISAESGIPTFRDKDGLWHSHRIEDVACPKAYERDPWLVHRFYNERRKALFSPTVAPNDAHIALAKLQHEFSGIVTIVTQNVDNLHERAGSTGVLHMHGELLKVSCTKSGKVFDFQRDVHHGKDACECCGAVGTLRPHIVWFGEMPLCWDSINEALCDLDLFVAIGTSGRVYPAADFASYAKSKGAKSLELNLESGSNCCDFDEAVYGVGTEIVPAWVESILKET